MNKTVRLDGNFLNYRYDLKPCAIWYLLIVWHKVQASPLSVKEIANAGVGVTLEEWRETKGGSRILAYKNINAALEELSQNPVAKQFIHHIDRTLPEHQSVVFLNRTLIRQLKEAQGVTLGLSDLLKVPNRQTLKMYLYFRLEGFKEGLTRCEKSVPLRVLRTLMECEQVYPETQSFVGMVNKHTRRVSRHTDMLMNLKRRQGHTLVFQAELKDR